MTTVNTEPYACPHCVLIGTWGVARLGAARLANCDEADASGVVHDPVWHAESCPHPVSLAHQKAS